jgi:NADH-ubiquinone oxidoreductase chain 2
MLKNIPEITYNNFKFSNTMSEQYIIIEYTLIILFIIIGGIFLMASSDIISIFLSIELQSYGLYILCASYRNSESSTSAGLTYFLLGALASSFILLSTSLIYANSGCTSLENLYIISNISENLKETDISNNIFLYDAYYLYISLIILSIGFLFKISASPFHFWSPDVYDAVPTIVTTFISILPKITILIFMLDIITHINKNFYINSWTSIFVMSSMLSLIIGTVLGLIQKRIKRLFAYSTISHIGFLLLCLSIGSKESIQAFIFYLMQYSISNLNAFFILITIGYSLYIYIYKGAETSKDNINEKELSNSPIQLIDQLKGYFYINPIISLSLAITLFSFAGIPPLIGFFAKLMVLSASIDSGYIFMSLVAILTSVIGGVYYLAIIKQMFFDNSAYEITTTLDSDIKNIVLSSSLTVTISILTSLILLFLFIPTESFNLISIIGMTLLRY